MRVVLLLCLVGCAGRSLDLAGANVDSATAIDAATAADFSVVDSAGMCPIPYPITKVACTATDEGRICSYGCDGYCTCESSEWVCMPTSC
jgi:hypothetical protein